jgi:hypothetical protein
MIRLKKILIAGLILSGFLFPEKGVKPKRKLRACPGDWKFAFPESM